jgi:hypothetical protein
MLVRLAWPLPGHLGSKWLDDVTNSFLAGVLTEADVTEVFLNSYQKHGLQDVRHEWQKDPSIRKRLPILLDALKAHEERRFTLSVPVLLAQLEGLIAEAKQHKGRFTGKTLVQYLESIRTRGSRFQRIAARFVVEILWADFQHGASLPTLSRHAILHGADVDYGTGGNSLRSILYFDIIRSALNQQEKRTVRVPSNTYQPAPRQERSSSPSGRPKPKRRKAKRDR